MGHLVSVQEPRDAAEVLALARRVAGRHLSARQVQQERYNRAMREQRAQSLREAVKRAQQADEAARQREQERRKHALIMQRLDRLEAIGRQIAESAWLDKDLLRLKAVPNKRRMAMLLRLACEMFEVPPMEVLSTRRAAPLVRVRMMICAAAVRLTSLSLPEIGRMLGGRDHTTIMHARDVVARGMRQGEARFAAYPAYLGACAEVIGLTGDPR